MAQEDEDSLKTGTRPEPPSASSPHRPASRTRTGSHPSDGRFASGEMVADRFRIVGLLGKGGMGEVYRADDLRLGQPVALKFLPDAFAQHSDRLDRFYNEVRVARQVSHPNVCRMYDIGEVGGLHYLAMEFVDGDDLASLLRRIGRLPEDKGLDIARQLCAGLAAAHDRGVLHRDLKPENIMIDGRGKVRITDFGLAGIAEEIAQADVRSGTPAYMSPEQLSGREVTPRSDVYSLGLVLYEIFTGKRAFEGRTFVELLKKHEHEAPVEPSRLVATLDPAIERVILRCLAKDPLARPSSALAVAGALPGADPLTAALLAGETPSPEMVAAAGGTGLPHPGLVAGAAFITVAATLALVFLGIESGIISRVPMEKAPAVLEDRAREILRTQGATEAADSAIGYAYDGEYLLDVAKRDQSRTRWDHLATNEPPVLQFWYRESPRPLLTSDPSGQVYTSNPPIVLSGMAGVWLSTSGRLVEFYRVPPQRDEAQGAPAPSADYASLFGYAALDKAAFKEAVPEWLPAFGFDERKAWTGAYAGLPDRVVRIEAAAYRGRPVWFKIIGDWQRPLRMEPFKPNAQQRLGQIMSIAMIVTMIVASVALARKNLVAGRGDRRGAITITIASIILGSLTWALRAHHLSDVAREFQLAVAGFAEVLLQAAFFATLYLALEPFVRRRHPEMLISWTRLLTGRLSDPLVASHAVIGTAAGALFALFGSTSFQGLFGIPPDMPITYTVDAVLSTPDALVPLLARLQQGVGIGLATLLLLVGMEQVVKKLWLAGVLTVIAIIAREALSGQAPWQIVFVLYSILFAPQMYALLRYGVVSFVFSLVSVNVLGGYPLTGQLGAWYSTPTRVVLVYVALVAWWGWRYGRPRAARS
ncbi:MAG: serine/threonine protein kinase [Vicinamibacteria bacterium]|nr:serine/threonine protein kinase [Vicinamibacteria bacterium]